MVRTSRMSRRRVGVRSARRYPNRSAIARRAYGASGRFRGARTTGNTSYLRRSVGLSISPWAGRNAPQHFFDYAFATLAGGVVTGIPMNLAATNLLMDAMNPNPTSGGWPPTTPNTLLQKGDSLQGYTANRIFITNVMLRATVTMAYGSAATGFARGSGFIGLVWDSAPRATMPTFLEVFDQGGPDGLARIDRVSRFRVLWRKDFNNELGVAYNGSTPVPSPGPTTSHDVNVVIPIGRMMVQPDNINSWQAVTSLRGALYWALASTGSGVQEVIPYATSTALHVEGRARVTYRTFV